MEVSFLIGKNVFSPSGEKLGYVTGAYLTRDLKKLTALSLADEEEETRYLPARALLACGDAVIARASWVQSPLGVPFPAGVTAYTQKGELLGTVCGWHDGILTISGEKGKTEAEAERIVCGETLIVYETAPVGRKRTPRKKPPVRKKSDPIPTEEEAFSHPMSQIQQNSPFDRGNLLGRQAKRNVYDATGNLLVAAGETVTAETLSKVRRRGKLLALTVSVLTNLT